MQVCGYVGTTRDEGLLAKKVQSENTLNTRGQLYKNLNFGGSVV